MLGGSARLSRSVWRSGLWQAGGVGARLQAGGAFSGGGGRFAVGRFLSSYSELVVGIPRETASGERRVALTPEGVGKLVGKGVGTVVVERGAGEKANFADEAYTSAGATVVGKEEAWASDVVLKVRAPALGEEGRDEVGLLRPSSTLVSLVHPAQNAPLLEALGKRGVDVLALDCVPRISRAQVYDVLSSQAGIAGNRAVVEAANYLPRFFAGSMSAAGRVAPARVLVIGGGVAGLAAVGSARALGAEVQCFDTREEVAEQVVSQGGKFLALPEEFLEEMRSNKGSGGYAAAMSDRFIQAEQELFLQHAPNTDVIISTALIPGQKAPLLVTQEAVSSMKPGSVTVDLAAENGGNVALTRANEVVTTPNGVTCLGWTDLPSRAPALASTLLSNNISAFFLDLHPAVAADADDDAKQAAKSRFGINLDDEVHRGALVLLDGKLMWPAPPPPSMAKVDAAASKPKQAAADAEEEDPALVVHRETVKNARAIAGGFAGLLALGAVAPTAGFASMMSVAALAGVAGVQVVTSAQHALHSPLLSVTNMISGLSVVGALSLAGQGFFPHTGSEALSAVATGLSAVNLAGGFLVTQRMLEMFRRKGDPVEPAHYYAIPFLTAVGGYGALHAMGFGGHGLEQAAMLASGLAAIGGIGGLATQETARLGNALGALGVSTGTLAALALSPALATTAGTAQAVALLAAGGAVGWTVAKRVSATDLPQTVAAFHSLVGLAATFTSIASFLAHGGDPALFDGMHRVSSYLGAAIGAFTATGSLIAFGKLQGLPGPLFTGSPLRFHGQHAINSAMGIALLAGLGYFGATGDLSTAAGLTALLGGTSLAATLGLTVGAGVGGGDAPVFLSVLNASSGAALLAEGFLLSSLSLTCSGALILCSGGFLSHHMLRGMNGTMKDVFVPRGSVGGGGAVETREPRISTVDQVADTLLNSKKILFVPGYGLAVASAQGPLAQVAEILQEQGVEVKFGVHPVAGRLPGQLNVLLAEQQVSYESMMAMEANEEFLDEETTVVAVGALDTLNEAAHFDEESAIYGMPVFEAWRGKEIIFFKRTAGAGYAGVPCPTLFRDNASLYVGDAKESTEKLLTELRARLK